MRGVSKEGIALAEERAHGCPDSETERHTQ